MDHGNLGDSYFFRCFFGSPIPYPSSLVILGFCEECFVDVEEWVEVSSKGELVTFGESYLGTDGSKLKEPWILGIIRLDGADGGLIHYIGEARPEELKIGMRMEAVFNEKRNGNILDIKHFRPSK